MDRHAVSLADGADVVIQNCSFRSSGDQMARYVPVGDAAENWIIGGIWVKGLSDSVVIEDNTLTAESDD